MKRHTDYASEAELARDCMQLMEASGWTVYPEILGIDLVCERSGYLLAIEAKQELNWKVLEQAFERRPLVNAVCVCVPGHSDYGSPCDRWRWGATSGRLMTSTMEYNGIGLLWVGRTHPESGPRMTIVRQAVAGVRSREEILPLLVPEARTHTVPGMPSCKRWSHWDVLELKYVDAIRKATPTRYEEFHGKFRLEMIIAKVEPGGLRRDGAPLAKTIDRVCALILNGRWHRLRLEAGLVWVAEDAGTVRPPSPRWSADIGSPTRD